MSQIAAQLNEVWNALRAGKGQRDEALVEVRIRNLRGIWDLRFPFDYPVSVLAGPNGSGKSTVLFACACAYRVPGRGPGDLAPGRLFPNFVSRQPAVRSDPAPQTQLEFHYLHRGARRSMTWRRGKSWSRRGDAQPERQVYLRTLANLTSPGEVRSILQLGRKQVRTETISPDLLIFAHRILPWRYQRLNLISGQPSRDLLFAEIEGTGETRYSEFHMSSGERTIVRISKDVSGLENALVLIDEEANEWKSTRITGLRHTGRQWPFHRRGDIGACRPALEYPNRSSLREVSHTAAASTQKSAASSGNSLSTSGPSSVISTGCSSFTPSGPSSAPT